jgi:hypothetical protein
MSRNRVGFTLIEIIVALMLSSLTVMIGQAVFSSSGDMGERLLRAGAGATRHANVGRFLDAAVSNLDFDGTAVERVAGTSDTVAFTTWMIEPDGSWARQAITLFMRDDSLFVHSAGDLLLDADATGFEIDYLPAVGAKVAWLRAWDSPVAVPIAIRLRVRHTSAAVDTMLLVVGPRG